MLYPLRTMLASLTAVLLTGCFMPTPLDPEDPPGNRPPSILSGDPSFLDGPVIRQASDFLEFKVVAEDADLDQHLVARLYYNNKKLYSQVAAEISLNALKDGDPVRRGTFSVGEFCGYFPAGSEALIFVFVGDQPFPEKVTPPDLPRDHFVYQYWIVKCV